MLTVLFLASKKTDDEEEVEIDSSTLVETGLVFVYQLRSFPSLDEYWKMQRTSQPLTIHVTADQRAEALLADR